jgi:hypothetical protein
MLILSADNGMNYGAHRFLEDKKTPFATRLPFFVHWPAVLGTEPSQISERLQNIDLAPTLCELAGCRMGPYPTGQRQADGISFADLLLGRTDEVERTAVLSSFRTPGARKVPRWYAIETTRHSALAERDCAIASEGGCRWAYVEYETGERELYDLSNGPCWEWRWSDSGDPCRLQNRAGKKAYAEIQSKLRKQLRVLRIESRR